MAIVVGGENGGSEFSGGEEMPKISPRIAAADAASAVWIERILILRVTRILDEHAAFAGVDAGTARGASRKHAIHHVDAERDLVGDLFRAAHTHQIARLSFGRSTNFGGHFTGDFVRFADGEPPTA